MTAETQSSHWFSFGKKINLTLPVFDCRQKLSWLIFLLKLCWGTGWMSLSRTSIRHFGSLISLKLFCFFCSSYWSTGFSIRWYTLSEFFSDRVKITICPLWWTKISVFYVILLKQMKPSNHQWKRQVKKNANITVNVCWASILHPSRRGSGYSAPHRSGASLQQIFLFFLPRSVNFGLVWDPADQRSGPRGSLW